MDIIEFSGGEKGGRYHFKRLDRVFSIKDLSVVPSDHAWHRMLGPCKSKINVL